MSKLNILMGATALVAANMAFAGAASAQTNLFGAGSSLIAPNFAGAMNCLGQSSVKVGTTTPAFDKVASGGVGFNGTVSTGINLPGSNTCSTVRSATDTFYYMSTGSGAGIATLYSNDPATFAGLTNTTQSQWGASATPAGKAYPSLQFAFSDAGLAGSDVANYNCAGTSTCTEHSAVVNGASQVGGTNYPNPAATYGPLIQFPALITPVVLAYNPVTKIEFVTNKTTGVITKITKTLVVLGKGFANTDLSGGLHLDMPTFCAIANGAVTSTGDGSILLLNGGSATAKGKIPTTTARNIELVGRSDSSGTTSIFYRALAAQCSGNLSYTYDGASHSQFYTNNFVAAGGTTLPGALQGGFSPDGIQTVTGTGAAAPVLGKFTTTANSGGVASYTAELDTYTSAVTSATVGATAPCWTHGKANCSYVPATFRIGYLGPDYVLPAVNQTQTNTYGLNIVNIVVGGTAIEPTAAAALAAFGVVQPPQSTSTGAYNSTNTAVGLRSAPQDWALPQSTTVTYSTGVTAANPLANPTLAGTLYPIVGTTDADMHSCYATASADMAAFVHNYETSSDIKTILGLSGFAPLPAAWSKAVDDTFSTNASGTNLQIQAGMSGTGICATVPGN